MSTTRGLALSLVVLAVVSAASSLSEVHAQTRLMCVDGANLLELSPATGAVLNSIPLVGAPGTVGALAYDASSDTLFLSSTSQDNLWTLDYNTGVLTLVGLYNVGTAVVMHGLEVDDTGQLYGYSTNVATGARFFSVDRTTGQATPISDPGFGGFGSLGFVATTGTMYLADTGGDQLWTIDRVTGQASVIGPFGIAAQVGVGLAYDPLLGMYAVNNTGTDSLWTLNLATGAATLVSNLTTGNALALAFVGNASTPTTPFCFGDGSAGACPCANNGAAGRGCANSADASGAVLTSSGAASIAGDSLVLTSSGELPTVLSIFLQGNAQVPPVVFGDGLRCAGGSLKRLYFKNAVGGVVSAPTPGDPSVSTQSAVLGDPLAAGDQRFMQTYYRDSNLAFCPAPPGNSWNVSSGLIVTWVP